MMKLGTFAAVASAYESEWAEFQAVQGSRNGATPQAFMDAVDVVKEHTAKDCSYKLSYTGPFADKSAEECKQMLGFKPKSMYGDLPKAGTRAGETAPTVSSIDWSTKGAVTPVENQGQC